MSIEVLKMHWRNEIDQVEQNDATPVTDIISLANKQARRTYLGGMLYVVIGLVMAASILSVFFADGFDLNEPELIGVIAVILVYGFGAWLHFKSISSNPTDDCTVSERIANEIKKAESQLMLYKKLPLLIFVPMSAVAMFIAFTQFNQSTGDMNAVLAMIANVLIYFGLVGFTYWGLEREIVKRAMPLIKSLRELQRQLEQ